MISSVLRREYALCLVAVLAAVVFSSCGRTANNDDLSLRLQRGRSYKMYLTKQRTGSEIVGGEPQRVKSGKEVEYTLRVGKADADGTASVKLTYDRTSVKIGGAGGGMTIDYDSAEDSGPVHPLVLGHATLVGQIVSMKLSPDGHIEHIQGVEGILRRMTRSLDDAGLDGSRKEAIARSLRYQYGERAQKQQIEIFTAMRPGKPVEVGDSWETRFAMSGSPPVILDRTWTLQARRRGIATIAVRSVISADPQAPPMQMGPLSITYDVSGEETGVVKMEEATGWILSAELTHQLSGEAKLNEVSKPITFESVLALERNGR